MGNVVTNKYHPTLPDKKALELIRAALEVRHISIRVAADMRGQQNAPSYGRPLVSPPSLKFRPCTSSGLALFFVGLPMSIISEWGDLQIAPSCTEEMTRRQIKDVLRRLAQAGVVLDLQDDPDVSYMLTGHIISVGGKTLPPVEYEHPGAFRTSGQAYQAYRAACMDISRR